MSQRNGDKARFHRIRKKTIVRRERQRILLAGAHIAQPKHDGGRKVPSGNQPGKPEPPRPLST
jgi:hypothetical protein